MARLAVLAFALGVASLAAADTACDGECAGTFDKCIGRDIFSIKSCCDDRDECVKFSKWYGQCRPKSNRRFDEDWLGVAEDCRECGVESRVAGTEFNFASNIYCELTFLGEFDVQECAAVCAQGPYVACDRFIADGVTSCYGYSELFEGGCFMRVANTAYESWLNCKGNGPAVQPMGGADDSPAALSVESLEADIAADEATTSTEKALAQRQRDVARK